MNLWTEGVQRKMIGNAWIIIGIIAAAIAAFAIPYGFHLKSNQQLQPQTKQDTSGEQSPNIISGTTPGTTPITQTSSGKQSPNVISGREGASINVTYDNPSTKNPNADKETKED